jgi:hypothetical protein
MFRLSLRSRAHVFSLATTLAHVASPVATTLAHVASLVATTLAHVASLVATALAHVASLVATHWHSSCFTSHYSRARSCKIYPPEIKHVSCFQPLLECDAMHCFKCASRS